MQNEHDTLFAILRYVSVDVVQGSEFSEFLCGVIHVGVLFWAPERLCIYQGQVLTECYDLT